MGDYHARFCKRGEVGNNHIDSNFVVSSRRRSFEGFNCSLNKTAHELGLKRRKSVLFLSNFGLKLRGFLFSMRRIIRRSKL